MTTLTNAEYADHIEKLAGILRANDTLKQPAIWIMCDTKEELIASIKAIGGKWVKHMPQDSTSDYDTVTVDSVDFAPFRMHIYRYRICRKTVTWDCQPFLSPEEEQEVETAIGEA